MLCKTPRPRYMRAREYIADALGADAVFSCSIPKQFGGLFHAVCDFYFKRTSAFAGSAGNAVRSMGLQCRIMLFDRGRNLFLHYGKVIKLVDHGDIDVFGAGLAVAAVGALAFIGMAGRTG